MINMCEIRKEITRLRLMRSEMKGEFFPTMTQEDCNAQDERIYQVKRQIDKLIPLRSKA